MHRASAANAAPFDKRTSCFALGAKKFFVFFAGAVSVGWAVLANAAGKIFLVIVNLRHKFGFFY